MVVDVEGHGREDIFADVDISRTVGWFTSLYPVVLEVGDGEGGEWEPGRGLSLVKEQLREVPNRGIGYGVLKYVSGDEEVRRRLEEMPEPEISFNYLGQVDQVLRDSTLFLPGTENTGSPIAGVNPRQHLLDVTGIVAQGKIQFNWQYSEQLHRRETIEKLAGEYLTCLRELIAHCRSAEAGGYTPSDFTLAKLTQKTLAKVASQLDD